MGTRHSCVGRGATEREALLSMCLDAIAHGVDMDECGWYAADGDDGVVVRPLVFTKERGWAGVEFDIYEHYHRCVRYFPPGTDEQINCNWTERYVFAGPLKQRQWEQRAWPTPPLPSDWCDASC